MVDFSKKEWQEKFRLLYGNEGIEVARQMNRYENLTKNFIKRFGPGEIEFFSTPGRTELSGNHTDHNHGRVLAASINLDSVAVVRKTDDNTVVLKSDAYPEEFTVRLDDLAVQKDEEGSTQALIRGIAAGFSQAKLKIGGFHALMTSNVLVGSGLSSSASVEVLIGTIFNYLYNEGKVSPVEIAKIGQFAENQFFGKPCGLMDQIACAVGGIVAIDFNDPASPVVEKVDFDFDGNGFSLLVVDTGGNHADLTEHYGAIPAEMKKVAQIMGKTVARDLAWKDFFEKLPEIRDKAGDRAALRVIHFIKENERVRKQVAALKEGKLSEFIHLVNSSGNSSNKWLQNSYPINNPSEQGINLALALTEDFLEKINAGACRVHGGGFAGTIQVFLPKDKTDDYAQMMEHVFGENSVKKLKIRPLGTMKVITEIS